MSEPCDTAGVGAPPPSPIPRGRRLYSLRNVRTLLADVIRELEADDPTAMSKPADRVARARALIYAAQVIGELIKSTDLEERLDAIEEKLRSRRLDAA